MVGLNTVKFKKGQRKMIAKTDGGVVRLSFGYAQDKKHRTVTSAYVTLPDGAEITGQAVCAKEDHFVKETGRKVALTKAVADLPRDVRAAIWQAYLNRA
jgi:hypothetical protein